MKRVRLGARKIPFTAWHLCWMIREKAPEDKTGWNTVGDYAIHIFRTRFLLWLELL